MPSRLVHGVAFPACFFQFPFGFFFGQTDFISQRITRLIVLSFSRRHLLRELCFNADFLRSVPFFDLRRVGRNFCFGLLQSSLMFFLSGVGQLMQQRSHAFFCLRAFLNQLLEVGQQLAFSGHQFIFRHENRGGMRVGFNSLWEGSITRMGIRPIRMKTMILRPNRFQMVRRWV